MPQIPKKKLSRFLQELTALSHKHGLYLDDTHVSDLDKYDEICMGLNIHANRYMYEGEKIVRDKNGEEI